MDSVPAWLLLLNTLLVGGFGYAGAWLATRGQRQLRRIDVQQADAALMRDMAIEVFEEIDRVASFETRNYLEALAAALKAGTEVAELGEAPAPDWGRLQGLVAVYFPSMMPILDGLDKRDEAIMAKIEAISRPASAEMGDAERQGRIGAIRAAIADGRWEAHSRAVKLLRESLISEVRRFVPGAASL